MPPIYLDSESVGFCGPAVLLQWSEDEGETVNLHDIWKVPIYETLTLIERMMLNPDGVIGFNLTFDSFQLCKIYTMFSLYADPQAYPEDVIEELARLESRARDCDCLKPVKACDLMLVARKGPYQSTMNRKPIKIRRVPTALAWQLAAELEKRVPLSDIYFARRANKFDPHFKIRDILDSDGEMITEFKDIVLSFDPSSALKALVVDALKVDPDVILLFSDISINKHFLPKEYQFAPFAEAIGSPGDWKGTWPDVIRYHINHWAYNQLARKYAAKDVEYLPALYKFFGSPELGDDDSELSCMVGAVRWKGFAVDIEGIKELKYKALEAKKGIPTDTRPCRRWIMEVLDPIEKAGMSRSTKKTVLKEIAEWRIDCPECGESATVIPEYTEEEDEEDWEDLQNFDPERIDVVVQEKIKCKLCNDKSSIPHPAAERAEKILTARAAMEEIELYDKLIIAGRLHADLKVIGAKSSRMSGAGKLNVQGIKRDDFVRSKFPLAFDGTILSGGDFDGFEVVLADAEYNDANLREDLKSGKKIHALFGVYLYPGHNYEEIVKSAKQPNDMYTPSKSGVFALIYGGDYNTLHNRLGIPSDITEKAYQLFCRRYPGVGIARNKVISAFMTMKQRTQYGKIEWSEPAEYVETMFGFRRYFTIEHQIEKALFDLATNPPKEWRAFKDVKVYRQDREQSAVGAVQSSLFAAAFNLQSSNMRAASNHRIQGSGAQITKYVQRKMWDLQLPGYNKWVVQPLNIHDEILAPIAPEYIDKVKQVVDEAVETFRNRVPLIKMDWNIHMENWASK